MLHVAFLRAVNVGGTKVLKMADLHAAFVKMGFKDAKTFIQSGNVIFTADAKEDILAKRINAGLKTAFGHDIPIIIRTLAQVERIVEKNPYGGKYAYVMLLQTPPTAERARALLAKANAIDAYTISGTEVFVTCDKEKGKSLFGNTWAERILKVRGTTRGVLSLRKLVAFAKG